MVLGFKRKSKAPTSSLIKEVERQREGKEKIKMAFEGRKAPRRGVPSKNIFSNIGLSGNNPIIGEQRGSVSRGRPVRQTVKRVSRRRAKPMRRVTRGSSRRESDDGFGSLPGFEDIRI